MASARVTYAIRFTALAVVYVVLAKVGLSVATVGKTVTLLWPPTGLGLAALLLWSRSLWPAIAVGAFIVNATTPGVSLATSAAITAGNTLEALTGATLLVRVPFRLQLDSARDVMRLVLFGSLAAPLVSATIGALALLVSGHIPAAELAPTWRVWWVGDAMGALVFAPALLSWGSRPADFEQRSSWEAFTLAFTLLATSAFRFVDVHATRYIVFPPVIWAALRFGPRGATAATLVVWIATAVSAISGHGDLEAATMGDNLMTTAAFMASVALTAQLLGATAVERQRAIRAREHFISIASHELRTPLAPLRLQVQRLLRGLNRTPTTLTNSDIVEALLVVDRQAARLTALLENVLDMTRLRLGRLPLRFEDVDAAALVEEVTTSLREALAQGGCSLTIERKGTTVGEWDRARLGQVVTNLLTNAIKHGGPSAIDISVSGDGDLVTIVVRDHGPGVPVRERERIFGRFEHADGGAPHSGLGLGLYVAREIVEAHGGRLSVSSPPGGGAAFEIDLPKRPPSTGSLPIAR
ncbi:MAG TPA: MASE1 domain-containing protein [Polyangia bacterium]|nr:MASE1 domain-containing protein [Polyangia bacterium]